MNEHSEKFEMVKDFYNDGQWKKKAVKNAVRRNLEHMLRMQTVNA